MSTSILPILTVPTELDGVGLYWQLPKDVYAEMRLALYNRLDVLEDRIESYSQLRDARFHTDALDAYASTVKAFTVLSGDYPNDCLRVFTY